MDLSFFIAEIKELIAARTTCRLPSTNTNFSVLKDIADYTYGGDFIDQSVAAAN